MAVEPSASSAAPLEVLARLLSTLPAGDGLSLDDVVTADALPTFRDELASSVAGTSGAVLDRLLKDAQVLYITVVRGDRTSAQGYIAELHVEAVAGWRVHGLVGLDAAVGASRR